FTALKPGGVCLTVEPGEGHATSEPTRKYVESYGVTEKDMPPRRIIAVAREVGFRSFRVYRRDLDPLPPMLADFDSPPPVSPTEDRPGRLGVALRFARKAARALLKGTCAEDHTFLFGHRPAPEPELGGSDIVWMRK